MKKNLAIYDENLLLKSTVSTNLTQSDYPLCNKFKFNYFKEESRSYVDK